MKKFLLFGFAALLLVAFCAPAMAAEKKVSFYGDFRFNTWWYKKSDNYVSNYEGLYNPNNKSYSELMFVPDYADSRFGAMFSEGPLSAQVEIRPTSDVSYRQWWGQYDFGSFQLLIGHTYTPACIAFSNSQFESEDIYVYGSFLSRLRTNQIRITVPFAMGSFKIAAQNNPTGAPDYLGGAPTNIETKMTLPEFEGCLTLNLGPATLDLFGGYGTYKLTDPAGGFDQDVNSAIYGAKVNVPFGPMYFTAEYYGGKNPGNYAAVTSSVLNYGSMLINTATGQTTDSKLRGYGAVVGYKVSDMMTAELGYFTQKNERYLQESDDNGAYYLDVAITPVKGLTIYPEIGCFNEKNLVLADGTKIKQGKRTYIGAYWKISF
jgi:hypothetical protein